jgi:hypothetical protein
MGNEEAFRDGEMPEYSFEGRAVVIDKPSIGSAAAAATIEMDREAQGSTPIIEDLTAID